jgi:hypothetical protein
LQDAGIPGVAGNYDSTVATGYKHCGCRAENAHQQEVAHQSFTWTLAHTSDDAKSYLASLPFRIDIRPFGGHATLVDVTGLVIYFSVAFLILRGTLL